MKSWQSILSLLFFFLSLGLVMCFSFQLVLFFPYNWYPFLVLGSSLSGLWVSSWEKKEKLKSFLLFFHVFVLLYLSILLIFALSS